MHVYHSHLYYIRRGALNRHVHGHPLAKAPGIEIRRFDLGKLTSAAHKRSYVALFAALLHTAVHILLHSAVFFKVTAYELAGLLSAHTYVLGETVVAYSVNYAKVYSLCGAALLSRYACLINAEHLGCSAGMYILAGVEGGYKPLVPTYVCEETKLYLGIVRAHQYAPRACHKGLAYLAAQFCADGYVLQIRLCGGYAACGCDILVEAGIYPAVLEKRQQAVHKGALEL